MAAIVISALSFVDRWFVEPVARRVLRSATSRLGYPSAVQRPGSASVHTPESGTTSRKAVHSTFTLADGASLAYEVLGSQYLTSTSGATARKVVPIVLVCGMTSVRVDFERLSGALVEAGRPVLLYDHRGMGDSTLGPVEEGEMNIESLARDLFELLVHLGWSEVAILGYSMGGVIAQQLLLLPHHPTNPLRLPFRVTHLLLAGTRSVVVQNAGLNLSASPASSSVPATTTGGPTTTPPSTTQPPPQQAPTPPTPEQRKAMIRRVVSSLVDPEWIASNGERFEYILRRATNPELKRSPRVIAMQGAALQKFNFTPFLQAGLFPTDIPVLLIHGKLDAVIPFHCTEETRRLIPHARLLQPVDTPGRTGGSKRVPSLDFGHFWFEYFDVGIWTEAIIGFVEE